MKYDFPELFLPMLGRHQAVNAAVAIAAAVAFSVRRKVSVTPHLAAAISGFKHAGRIEVVKREPLVLLDVAHNLASIEALLETLKTEFPGRKRTGIFAFSRDKDQVGMLRLLLPAFQRVVLTRFVENPRATPTEQLLEMAKGLASEAGWEVELETAETPAEAWAKVASHLGSGDLCVAAGSVFLVAELRGNFQTAAEND
jgi:dihydrofolate synthase/folylpolyglutamate synthase